MVFKNLSAWISEKGKWVIVDIVRFEWNFQGLCILAFLKRIPFFDKKFL
jgi:hypothetical protein